MFLKTKPKTHKQRIKYLEIYQMYHNVTNYLFLLFKATLMFFLYFLRKNFKNKNFIN